MKQLLIIGARGWGREVFNMLPYCVGYGTDFEVKGFLDDKADALDGKPGYPPIIDSVEHYTIQPDDVFICALGDAHAKKHYVDLMLSKGGKFITLICKTARISQNTKLGEGCIVCGDVLISCDVTIGSFVTFQGGANIGHDAVISDYCHIGTDVFLGGAVQIGSTASLQTRCVILPHIQVGDDATVGAGSVVIRRVKNNTTVFGNPAAVLKY